MISFNLKCAKEHVFEAWFNSGSAYDEQVAAGDVACPICGNKKIEKAPMAPRVNMGKSRQSAANMPSAAMIREIISEVHRHVQESCEDVGEEFADEARRIHYGEAEERGIHGQASDDDIQELAEENIEVLRLPNLPRSDA